jgi:hypothetical protein
MFCFYLETWQKSLFANIVAIIASVVPRSTFTIRRAAIFTLFAKFLHSQNVEMPVLGVAAILIILLMK